MTYNIKKTRNVDNYNYEILYNKDKVIKTLDIELSKTEKYNIVVNEDIKKLYTSIVDDNKKELL